MDVYISHVYAEHICKFNLWFSLKTHTINIFVHIAVTDVADYFRFVKICVQVLV